MAQIFATKVFSIRVSFCMGYQNKIKKATF